MATTDRRYYYLSRRLVHATVLWALAIASLVALARWATAPRWLPEVAYALDVDAPLRDPDALMINAAGQNAEIDRLVARSVAEHPGRVIVLLGSPFTSDILVPERTSARLRILTGLGVPRDAIVEVYEGENLYQSLDALRAAALRHGWRRILSYGTPPGTRRTYLAGRAILSPAGIEFGSTTIPTSGFDPNNWWNDNRERGRIVYAWLGLGLGWVTGHY